MSKQEKIKTDFIEFLNQEYLSSYFQKEVGEDKVRVCETTKLQKVLDVFIAEEKNNKLGIVDDVLVKSWQAASQEQKTKLLNSFLEKQSQKKKIAGHKNELDEISVMLKNMTNGFENKTTLITGNWKTLLVTACFLAFVVSASIVRLFPSTADDIVAISDRIFLPFTKASVALNVNETSSPVEEKISKDELQQFIKNNSKYLKLQQSKGDYSVTVSLDELKGRVAGVSEEKKNIPPMDVAVPSIEDLSSVKQKEESFLENFVKKQLELADIVNEKLDTYLK